MRREEVKVVQDPLLVGSSMHACRFTELVLPYQTPIGGLHGSQPGLQLHQRYTHVFGFVRHQSLLLVLKLEGLWRLIIENLICPILPH